MNGESIISMFRSLVDDESISQELGLQIANTAKDEIEEEREWRMLLLKDTSNSITSSHSYDTPVSLPSAFREEHKIALVNSSKSEDEIDPIPYEDLIKNKDYSNYYAIDIANVNLYISGTVAENKTIYIWYFKFTPDVAWDTEPGWPDRFHKIIAYRMAEIWLAGIDVDTLTRLQHIKHREVAERMYKNMIRWDSRLWLRSMNNQVGFAGAGRGLKTNVIRELQ